MSQTLRVYSVDFEDMLAAPGSRWDEVVELVRTDDPYFADEFNEFRDDYNNHGRDAGDPPIELTLADAVALIVNGESLAGYPGWFVDDAYQGLCWALGDTLDMGRRWSVEWQQRINAALRTLEIPLNLEDLTYRGPLFNIGSDWVAWGRWTPEQIAGAEPFLDVLDRPDAGLELGVHADLTQTLVEIRKWVRHAAERPGDGLIGMFS